MRYIAVLLCCLLASTLFADTPKWKAGVATQIITPSESMWMAGYAGRTKPSDGKEHDLYVKALAIEDPDGKRLVVVTSDLIGIPRSLATAVAAKVEKKTKLPRERLMITCSHTHCGPVINDNLADMYLMPEEEAKKIAPYTQKVEGWMVDIVIKALGSMKPATIEVGQGTAGFAVNRRTNREPEVPDLLKKGELTGPVDHDVPVLAVRRDGKLAAIVFGYACHNTTMAYQKYSGDYAGFAQIALEEKHKDAVALFWAGCGGDQNPLPRRTVELCQKYGKELAAGVDAVLKEKMKPLTGKLTAKYAEAALALDKLPEDAHWTAESLSKSHAHKQRAKRMLETIKKNGKLDDHYRHYPVQVWQVGDQVTWVSLGGEVVIDYARRIKKELAGDKAVWVTAYSNDVMAYIPSERVLKEGGYEGESSMVYYGQPTKWAPGIEKTIIAKVHELAGKAK